MPKRSSPAAAVDAAINQKTTHQVVATKSETFEGPLPHPDLLAKYETILPGIAERIVSMAESEQNARLEVVRQDSQNKSVLVQIASHESDGALKAHRSGQLIGLFLSVFCVICSLICALLDKPAVVTCSFLAVPTASFIGSFMPRLWKRSQEKKDIE